MKEQHRFIVITYEVETQYMPNDATIVIPLYQQCNGKFRIASRLTSSASIAVWGGS